MARVAKESESFFSVLIAGVHKRRFAAAVDEFAIVCRGLQITAFGAM